MRQPAIAADYMELARAYRQHGKRNGFSLNKDAEGLWRDAPNRAANDGRILAVGTPGLSAEPDASSVGSTKRTGSSGRRIFLVRLHRMSQAMKQISAPRH